ncbi:MAG TPA: sortase, partial [Povalibacter sp.]
MSPSRIIETAAWIIGVGLLATYFTIRTWSASASEDGVTAMRQAREEHAALLAQNNGSAAAVEPPRDLLTTPPPDTSSWDKKRVAEYQAALAHKDLPEGVIRIPRLKLEVPVYEGTSDVTLNRGAGRIAGTADMNTSSGNIGIAAHRDGFFRPLKDIEIGDTMFVDTITATREYRVTKLDIV